MVLAAILASALGSTVAPAPPPRRDAFLDSTRQVSPRPLPPGLARLFQAGHVSSWEPRLGVPTFFWAPRPSEQVLSPRAQGLRPAEAARQHLLRWAPLYGLTGEAVGAAALIRLHDLGEGAVIATFQRTVGEVPVFRDRVQVIMDQRLQLVALSGYLSPVQKQAGDFRLAEPAALAAALGEASGRAADPAGLRVTGVDTAGMSLLAAAPGSGAELGTLARARKVLFGLPEVLVPAWYVEASLPDPESPTAGAVAEVVSAVDGRVLWKRNLVHDDAFTYRVWADPTPPYLPYDSPYGTALSPLPSADPTALLPTGVDAQLVTLSSAPFSRGDPWLAPSATTSSGNNVDAYADLASPDGFGAGDQRATTTGDHAFDRTINLALNAGSSGSLIQAGTTQLFYTVNFLHDWYYDRGFAEADGNAQLKNFGRGGVEGDPIHAEAQDYGGTSNANMMTPADGASPRMQMYVWAIGAAAVTALGRDMTGYGGASGMGPSSFDLTATAAVASPLDGCGGISTNLTGQIAIIARGTCTFEEKNNNAAAAGARGVIIVDNVEPTVPLRLAGSADLPILLVSKADGDALKAAAPLQVRMQRGGLIKDGDLDATIVSHEWTHYLSNRLVGDAAGLNTLQADGMGEGWSDTGAMLLIVRPEDTQVASNAAWAGTYAMGAFAYGPAKASNIPYFGLRRFPYSTDFSKNPLTFKHIQDNVPLPTGAPATPGTDLTGGINSEVHNTGEVWAEMLWECYAALLKSGRLPFADARERMKGYLVASLKGTPMDPTFVEARDALLAVAAATDPRDQVDFQAAFARRGLGLFAVAPPRTSPDNGPLVEDFSTGSDLLFVEATLDDSASSCDHDGFLDVGETGRLRVVLRNVGTTGLSASTATVTGPAGVTITPATITLSASQPFTLATGTATVTLPANFAADHLDLTITWSDPGLPAAPVGHPRSATFSAHANVDTAPAISAAETAETGLDVWTHVRDTALSTSWDWTTRQVGPLQRTLYGLDAPSPSDLSLVSPALQVGAGPLVITLVHRWAFETSDVNYDGAAIELSTNGGQTWDDLIYPGLGLTSGSYDLLDGGHPFSNLPDGGFAGVDGGYNGVLVAGSTNHLGGRPAFVATSPGYPAFVTSVFNLGTAHASQSVQVRLRVGSDDAAAVDGWDVDQISFAGVANTPFPGLVPNDGAKACTAAAVVANPGANQTVDEGTVVFLDGTASTGPAGQPLVGSWVQTAGPQVVLYGEDGGTLLVTFQAPQVSADTTLGFELSVRAGTLVSAPAPVSVVVKNVGHAPSVGITGPSGADAGTEVTLVATAVDPDGDEVALTWSQTGGTAVTLSSTTTPQVSFTTPKLSKAEDLTFKVVASDGHLSGSATKTVSVGAAPGCGCQSAGAPEGLVALAGLLTLLARARRRPAAPGPRGG